MAWQWTRQTSVYPSALRVNMTSPGRPSLTHPWTVTVHPQVMIAFGVHMCPLQEAAPHSVKQGQCLSSLPLKPQCWVQNLAHDRNTTVIY